MSTPQTTSSARVQCQRKLCQREFDVMLPEPALVNGKQVSALIWSHPQPAVCPYCAQAHLFVINFVKDYSYTFMPLEAAAKTDSSPRIIGVPASLPKP